MTTLPKNTFSDAVVENYLFIAEGFRLIWRTRLKFDETRPTILFNLKEYNGLKVGDQVKLDLDSVKRRNFHSYRQEEVEKDCEIYNSYIMVVGGFVKLKGFSWNHRRKKVSIEHIFAILVNCKPQNKAPTRPLVCMDPPGSLENTEKILLFWTEILKKVQ